MNSPYCGKFRVSQQYKPGIHDGLDLVGIDSKDVHATISGTVHFAGWENENNHSQGFGQFVCIRGTDNRFYYFGHLSKINVKAGQTVSCTEVIGVEGSTGYSTGSHCHYEIRSAFYKGATVFDVCAVSGIKNVEGTVQDDGYRPSQPKATKKQIKVTVEIDDHEYSGLLTED
jgi:murein DD-endopeptidase MepM/ murein hydrolase activator NlpD